MQTTADIKLTPKQKEVISMMRDGWELSKPYKTGKYFQTVSPGLESVDETKYFSFSTKVFDALSTMKLIALNEKKESRAVPIHYYILTELGKSIKL